MGKIRDPHQDRLLYEDTPIKIYTSNDPEEHDIMIADTYFLFQRGILETLARAKEDITSKLDTINPEIGFVLKMNNIPTPRFARAIANARITELEKEANYFAKQAREAKS